MNQFWKEAQLAVVMGVLVPAVLLGAASALTNTERPVEESAPPTQVQETEISAPTQTIPVLMSDGTTVQMELGNYLTGVILAEMPVSFEEEARKAQAVVARTYTIRAWEKGSKHENAAVCTDSSCCQAYISTEDYLAKGGTQDGIAAMTAAVEDTEGLVLTYDGALIEATYFSCSGGSTEDAVAVWGTDVPYLQAVSSPGEEYAAHYTDTVTFTAQEFSDALDLDLSGVPSSWFGSVTYTAGGGVDTMVIGGNSFGGTELRKALGLRSTAFTITTDADSVAITTRGYGHRVGMSQYGADAMAASGSSCEEILAHYYQGAVLEQWID